MRSRPDGEYKYIAHARDHFIWFSWATALENKKAIYVAILFSTIYTVGSSTVLQSDNGKEFVARIIHLVQDVAGNMYY